MKLNIELIIMLTNSLLFVCIVRYVHVQMFSSDMHDHIRLKKIRNVQIFISFLGFLSFIVSYIKYETFIKSFMWVVATIVWGLLALKYHKKYRDLFPPEDPTDNFECYEMHAYSRFAGCKNQCKECKEKETNN